MRGAAAALLVLTVSCNGIPSRPSPIPTAALEAPQSRSLSAMAYDQKHKVTLLYGGWPTRGYPYFDTWAWDGTHWAQQHPATEPRLWSPSMVYDQARQQIILFGTTVASGGSVDGVAGQTWAWDGANWRQAHPRASPGARHSAQLVYDSTLKEVIMFGGIGFKSEAFTDTWAWNGIDWHKLSGSIPGLPDGGVFGAAAYDAVIDRVVLYKGFSHSSAINPAMWLFDGTGWTQQRAGGGALPTDGLSMIYDPALQKLVLFGGEDSRNIATGVGRNLTSAIWLWGTHLATTASVHSPARAKGHGDGLRERRPGDADLRRTEQPWRYRCRARRYLELGRRQLDQPRRRTRGRHRRFQPYDRRKRSERRTLRVTVHVVGGGPAGNVDLRP